MKIVYVAGPFTARNNFDLNENILRAERLGRIVAGFGAMPLIPHANTRHFVGLETPRFWYEGTLELLRRSDAIALVDGWQRSTGAVAEHDEAQERGMPIFDFSDRYAEVSMRHLEIWVRNTPDAGECGSILPNGLACNRALGHGTPHAFAIRE